MFETAELGHRLTKTAYGKLVPGLRADLLAAQFDLARDGSFPVVLLVSGVRGAGKGETVNLLNAWMDPRHIHTHAFDDPSDEETERPPMWRYWRALPPKGQIGILFGSWYTAPIIDRVFKRSKTKDLMRSIDEINHFEKMLADEGALILKFWFHLGKDPQKERLRALEADPETRWRITRRDWKFFKKYDRFYSISENVLRQTSMSWASWVVVEGANREYRAATVGKTLLEAMRKRLDHNPGIAAPQQRSSDIAPLPAPIDHLSILDKLNLSAAMPKARYRDEMAKLQRQLALLTRQTKFADHNVVCVFEGMDAAGKGGAIRRITAALDARLYGTVPIAAPTDEERAQPYLWRFWRHIPRRGRFMIYDRSWYGRVLVERIEGLCGEDDWMRAYSEINEFEDQLTRGGTVIAKFWLQISKEEQLRRFEQREKTSFKQFKITAEDWRNRDKWEAYQAAAAEMIERTGTAASPWILVAANDKYHARVKILGSLVGALHDRLTRA